MERILLATYSIRIKNQGNNQLLYRFNGETDFLNTFRDFTNHILANLYQLRDAGGNTTIHLTLEGPANINDRVIHGYFSSGVSGETYKIKNMQTNTTEMEVGPDHGAFRDVFFYLYIPEGRNIGYLILQRKAKFGIKTVLTEAIYSYMRSIGYQNYKFEINNLLHDTVYRQMMDLGSLKKVELIKRRIPSSLEQYLTNPNDVEEIPGVFKTSFNSATSLPHIWKGLLDRLFRQDISENDRIEIENVDEQFDEIEFQLELNGKRKSFYVARKSKIQPDLDVTNDVETVNGIATTESLIRVSQELINDVLEVHPI